VSTDDQEDSEERAGGFRLELLQSYAAFAAGALRRRWLLCSLLFGVGVSLTVAAFLYLPRTFSCQTVLMTQWNPILDGRDSPVALAGAEELILRHENLEAIIRDGKLTQVAEQRRPPLLKLKDRVSKLLTGELTEKLKIASLVGTLETRLGITVDKANLTIKADWTDGVTAAELAEAARENFLHNRRSTEMSAFEEKMAILEGHAVKIKEEVGTLLRQAKTEREQTADQIRARVRAARDTAAQRPLAAVRVTRAATNVDGTLPQLNERLAATKAKLAGLEAERSNRLREEQAKLADLKLKYTPSYPQVITQEERVAAASAVTSELQLLRTEASDLQKEITQREILSRGAGATAGATSGGGAGLPSVANEPLLPEVMQFLDREDADPVLSAQLSSAVVRYSRLREDISDAKIQLDLAEAAFNRRYQIVVPAEVPIKPTKPKPGLIIGAGLAISLLLALIIPLLLEIQKGTIVERWQVHHLQLPVLAELRLPPNSQD